MNNTDDYPVELPSLADEFATAHFGDKRLTVRLGLIAQACSRAPGRPIPDLLRSDAELEAYYRFVNNPHVHWASILEPHVQMSVERAVQAGLVLVVHDTTELEYSGEVPRQGLGPLRGKGQGFLAHFALGIAGDESHRPLGVLGLRCWARPQPPPGRKKRKGRRKAGSDYAKQPDKESERWGELLGETSARLRGRVEVVHIADRETDSYPLLSQMAEQEERFVIRGAGDRAVGAEVVVGTRDRMTDVLQAAPLVAEREVVLSRRQGIKTPRAQKGAPDRDRRVARLEIGATRVMLRRPPYWGAAFPPWLWVNVVQVQEPDPPPGQEPVRWVLYTREPIDTTEQVLQIVDWYRARWIIEELFCALKTGCAVEKRQNESFETLSKVLAVFVPMAWQMLLLRTLARAAPQVPATAVLTEQQIEVLGACGSRKMSERPTVREALYAVAGLGGHIKNNGEPGWKVLGRGMERLWNLEAGWAAAQRDKLGRCDR